MYKFGIDVGGTTVKLGLFGKSGELVEKYEIPTDKSDRGSHIIDDITAKLKAVIEEKKLNIHECLGVGIGLPGPVDGQGSILGCVNLGWGTFPVEMEFSKAFCGVPVRAVNDANAAALGEQAAGAGRGMKNLIMVTLGTGVGGGIIADGRILTGAGGGAGEIGHITVNTEEKDACNCGKTGCLEQYASATGVVRMAGKLREQYSETRLPENCSAKDIFDEAKTGDSLAVEVVQRMGKYLGLALASSACVVNPEGIVIGGGVSRAGTILLDEVEKNFQRFAFGPCRDVKFLLAELGNDAGIYGAAALIR